MKSKILFALILFISTFAYAEDELDSLLTLLDAEIARKEFYENEKNDTITSLRNQLFEESNASNSRPFILCEKLHENYFTFNYDSAIAYANKMLVIATNSNDQYLITRARIKISATLLASGIFSEVKGNLNSINISYLDTTSKINYYYIYSRLFFDMADYYQRDYFTQKFEVLGLQYLDSALQISASYPAQYLSLDGLRNVRTDNIDSAISIYETLFDRFYLTGRQYAIDASTYAYALEQSGNLDEAMYYLIHAAIEDLRLVNKENFALIKLADLLYNQGKIIESSKYLNVALDDATRYGALQRKFQISQLQPIIEASKLQIIEKQSARIKKYAMLVTALSVIIIVVLVFLNKQYISIKKGRNELNKSYSIVQNTNRKLLEANLINEEYIAKFFETNSDLIDKIEDYKQTVENKILLNKIIDLKTYISNLDIQKEREDLFRIFDSVFFNLFPDFVQKFNDLFEESDQIILKNNSEMNTNLRIFALIRLGINDTEKIANILNYSVNTINTYKTKIKNKSKISNEDFEDEIMRIQSFRDSE